MMGWAIAILFGAAILLLILSFVKTKKSAKEAEQQMEQVSFTFMDELYKLQQKIRNIEIDAEITATEAGLLAGSSSDHRLLLREVIDLQRRGYSIESIAAKKQMTQNEIQSLLAPYTKTKDEGGKVTNDI